MLRNHILEVGAWEYFTKVTGEGGTAPNWEKNCDDATEVVPAPVGEASVLWNPSINRWICTYLNENTSSVELREADRLWGPWTTPHALASAGDYPQLYGAFMTPSFLAK